MNYYEKTVLENIKQEKYQEYTNELIEYTEKLIKHSGMTQLALVNDKKLSYTRDDDKIYLFLEEKNKTSVCLHRVHDFEKDSSIDEILHYPLQAFKEKEELYEYEIINFKNNIEDQNEKNYDEIKERLKKVLTKEHDLVAGKSDEEIAEIIEYSMKEFQQKKHKIQHVTDSLGELRDFSHFLSQVVNMPKRENAFFENMIVNPHDIIGENIDDIALKLEFFLEACIHKNKNSSKKAFVYNDLDNNIWKYDDKSLVVSDQTCGFFIQFEDKKNFNVFFVEKEYVDINQSIASLQERLKTNTVDLHDKMLIVKNGKVEFFDPQLSWILELNLTYGNIEIEKQYQKKIYDIDIYSYEYQKNYYYKRFGYTEFEFIAQALLTLGGGFEYDQKTKSFVDPSVKYKLNIQSSDTRNQIPSEFSYCYPPKDLPSLSPQWIEAITWFNQELKEKRPQPKIFQGNDVNLALDDVINQIDKLLEKCQKKDKKLAI